MKPRRKYDVEFKEDVLKMVLGGGTPLSEAEHKAGLAHLFDSENCIENQ